MPRLSQTRSVLNLGHPKGMACYGAIAAATVGLIGIVAWTLRLVSHRLPSAVVPHTLAEPLAILIGSVAIICVLLRRRGLGIIVGAGLAALGTWVLLVPIMLDGAPVLDRGSDPALLAPAPHLSSTVAIGIAILGVSIILINGVRAHLRTFVGEASGLVVVAFGLSGVIGQLLAFQPGPTRGPLSGIGLVASLGFLAIGIGLFAATSEPLRSGHRSTALGLGTRVVLLVTSLTLIPIIAMAVVTTTQLQGNALRGDVVELGALFLLISLALAVSFSRTILRPLSQIVRAVTAFGEGSADVELPTNRKDEAGSLARAFERMVGQVQSQTAALRLEVIERREAQHRLWDAAATLEHRNVELRASEARFRRLADSNIIGICVGDETGRLYEANDYFLDLVGYTRDDLEAGRLSWLALTPPDLLGRVQAGAQAVMEHGACKPYELEYIHKNGTRIPVQVGVARLDLPESRGIAFVLDLTEHHQMRRELAHAQKMESIGQLAAGIAHEINTPTQYVSDNVRFLDDAFGKLTGLIAWYRDRPRDCPEGTSHSDSGIVLSASDLDFLSNEIPAAIRESLDGLERVASIVSAMREFSHPGRTERSLLDLHQAIESTITVSRNEWKYVADVETDFDDALPLIPGLVGELNQVFLNLIVNAAQAIAARDQQDQKGTITIQTRRRGDNVVIRVTDTGVGIPRGIRDRVFDPFFTTKEIGKGTGQGLAVARSIIVDKHGGAISCEGEPGRGATFIIQLPVSATEAQAEHATVGAIADR